MKRHKRSVPPKDANVFTAGRNDCGKVAFGSRKQARRAEQNMPGRHVRPYRCVVCKLFHLGHLPVMVREGWMSADEYYNDTPNRHISPTAQTAKDLVK